MDILIIGGTRFVGRALAESVLEAGHQLTLFNRGNTNTTLFPQAEHLRGDRFNEEDLQQLRGRKWDAVIDTCAYFPRAVDLLAEYLAPDTHYTLISTISVYDNEAVAKSEWVLETTALSQLEDPTTEEVTGATYGGLKVLCEARTKHHFGNKALIIRPGLIVGPYDYTDRFNYWVIRYARGGEMLVPRDGALQVIDARDLADFTIKLVSEQGRGIYNGVAPSQPVAFSEVFKLCADVIEAPTTLHIVDEATLLERGVQPWTELPLWLPVADNGLMRVSNKKAVDAGFVMRPLAQTIADILAWYKDERGLEDALQAGMDAGRERALLLALDDSLS